MPAVAYRRLHGSGAFILLSVLACACASTPRAGSSRPVLSRTPTITSGSADALTRQEIDSLMPQYPSAYEMIHRARPNMLVSRDVRLPYPTREGLVSEPTGIKVFVDAVYVGGIDMLRRIPSRSVLFIQHLSPTDATTRYGSGMVAGAIVITTGTRWR